MAASNFKSPPKFENNDSYENWEKAVKLWRLVTDIPKGKQGAAIVLSLQGKAYETVLEMEEEEITAEDGVKRILDKLGTIYKKDKIDSAYEAFEKFIHYKREPETNISVYITEFERRYVKAKAHGFTMSSSSLAYFLLNQAKLSEDHKKLVKATISELDLEEMKTKLRKIFSSTESSGSSSEFDVSKVKI